MSKWLIREEENIADLIVEVYGKDKKELLANILKAFTGLITKINKIKEEKKIRLNLEEKSFSQLVFAFIEELIYLKDVKFLVFKTGHFKLEVKSNKGIKLRGEMFGSKLTKETPVFTDIKALAEHKFAVKRTKKGYKCLMVFDV